MILGHERQITYLNKVMERGRLAHAYLFYGPEHIGKFTIAKIIAKKLSCVRSSTSNTLDIEACNDCVQCRSIDQNLSPDIHIIDTESLEHKSSISIDEIRELKRQFSIRSAGFQWRIAIINNADKLTQEAVNAFLKLLEEPGEKSLIILVAPDREMLLPTIVSRTQSIRFSLVSEKILNLFLASKIKDEVLQKEILGYAMGKPGVMMRLLEEESYLGEERKFSRVLDSALSSGLPHLLQLSGKISSDGKLRSRAIEKTIGRLRQKMIQSCFTGKVGPYIKHLKSAHRIALLIETTNVNPRLALDAIFMETHGS